MAEALKHPLVTTAIAGGIEALGLVSAITIKAHRNVTHESLELSPAVEFLADTALYVTGTIPEVWADVHGPGHHRLRDATFVDILKISDHLEWRKEHPEVQHPPIPEAFPNLDPEAELYPEDIEALAKSVRDLPVADKKTIKDLYDRPETYSVKEMEKLFDTETPRYFYEEKPGIIQRWLGGKTVKSALKPQPRTVDSIVHWLRDAHSPALHKSGTLGVLLHNFKLYRISAKPFQQERTERHDFDTSTRYKNAYLKHRKWAIPVGFAVNILPGVGKALVKGELSQRKVASIALHGSARIGLAYLGLNIGGNVTNAFGHDGVLQLVHAFVKGGFKGVRKALTGPPNMKPDGSYTNNSKGLSLPTLDEVGGQEVHHKRPDKIAYSEARGLRKFEEAPYGTTLEVLAQHNIGLRPGPQFGERDNPEGFDRSKRPDMPAEAVLMLEGFRRRTRQQKQQTQVTA